MQFQASSLLPKQAQPPVFTHLKSSTPFIVSSKNDRHTAQASLAIAKNSTVKMPSTIEQNVTRP